MTQPRTGTGSEAGFDLSPFFQVFFEEAADNLSRMEALLLELDPGRPDGEALNAVFRCAHSIKGGAATFGFTDVADLTHVMETLLDRVRRRELGLTSAMVDVLLESGDALRELLARHSGATTHVLDASGLVARIRACSEGCVGGDTPAAVAATPVAAPPERSLELVLGPLERVQTVDDVAGLFAEIPGLGSIEPLDGGSLDGERRRRFLLHTTSTDDELLEVIGFHLSREQVAIVPRAAETAPVPTSVAASPSPHAEQTEQSERGPGPGPGLGPGGLDATTLRVSVEKIDQLLNLVGELVITQSMLAQTSGGLDPKVHRTLVSGLADLERNTRLLQQAVMSIRMIPMAVVFNRFPRMLRELATRLGKQVELRTVGEATELDKGLVERITDPLTHLVRNAVDHGIETPQARAAAGKPATASITLSAEHRGGSILIEVRDDGRGLDRARILAKAAERGLAVHEAMSDQEVWNLVFAPGFSTADTVTDVSGRGVGMDVVRSNIAALGGTVEIDSAQGVGTRVAVRLPLTLAIMDAMSVGVADEIYVLPLASVVESIHLDPASIRSVAGANRVAEVRGEFLPVVALDEALRVPRFDGRNGNSALVVIEAEGARAALLVDELIGQHQVVVKNLESNYRKVPGIAGATIAGDGRVALILDAAHLIRRARH